MSKVAVVFWSATGNTETMANCIAEGANGTIVPCSEMNAAKLAEFDAVAFGCPAMGAEQLEESCLLYTSPSTRDSTRYRMPSSA